LTDAEAVTLAHEGQAALFEMSEVLPDPGELNVPVPDAPDTVIPFEAISGKAQEQEKSEQEPEQQPPEQGEQPKPEVEKADKPDAYGQALCQQLHVDPMCRVG
jgi:ParB family chromosome partitioning protein